MKNTKGITPWQATAKDLFGRNDLQAVYERTEGDFLFSIYNCDDTFWLLLTWPNGGRLAFRLAYTPGSKFEVNKTTEDDRHVIFHLTSAVGEYTVTLQLPGEDQIFRYTTSLKATTALLIPFWPRDLVPLNPAGSDGFADGDIYIKQVGTRTGLVYFSVSEPRSGTVLYMQNLTALNDYCQQTETSATNLVGGDWPEIGFTLPITAQKPLPAGKDIIISDAFVALSTTLPEGEFEVAKQFMNLLAQIYLKLPLPDTQYHDWPDMVKKGLEDLQHSHGCWCHADGHSYLNAYVSDYATPPEIMVQLAVLLPLSDYKNWSKADLPVIPDIKDGLDAFYDEKLGTIVRWLPAAADQLDQSEEQLKPNVMDSWYLHHPLINLSRLAMLGDKHAEELFFNSIDFAIEVARHFKYEWPVFYNMETLDVIKAESKPTEGGERDVAGIYALVMLHAFKLSKDERYLNEAKKAAKKLISTGFEMFYQANNTAFGANAMLWLWQITKEQVYLDLSYLCLANIFKNVQLWDCNYGYAKHYPTFFGVFPLGDAPYTAAYEEQEVFAAFHNYLLSAEGDDILPSVKLLLAEFIRYIAHRAAYYYPPNLPKEMLSDEVKMGEVDPKMWIAIEDIHDGWEKSGEVGQEVYGAGVAFGIVPRHFYKVKGEDFMVYIDYPSNHFIQGKANSLSFILKGDSRLSCRMVILNTEGKSLPIISVESANKTEIEGKQTAKGRLEYIIQGDQKIKMNWK